MENKSNAYKTKQREAILEYIVENKEKHITADEIITRFSKQEHPIGKSTVYRYLDKLCKENIIRKFTIDGSSSACYQYGTGSESCHEHYHFKCENCGELFHVGCKLMNGIKEHVMAEHDFVIDSSKTVFYGMCGKCRK